MLSHSAYLSLYPSLLHSFVALQHFVNTQYHWPFLSLTLSLSLFLLSLFMSASPSLSWDNASVLRHRGGMLSDLFLFKIAWGFIWNLLFKSEKTREIASYCIVLNIRILLSRTDKRTQALNTQAFNKLSWVPTPISLMYWKSTGVIHRSKPCVCVCLWQCVPVYPVCEHNKSNYISHWLWLYALRSPCHTCLCVSRVRSIITCQIKTRCIHYWGAAKGESDTVLAPNQNPRPH